MKIVAVSDLHLNRYGNDRLHPKTRLPERLDSLIRCMLEVITYCKKNSIDTILINGDSFHGKSVISNLAQNLFEDLILKRNPDIRFILVDGNHDLSSEREGSLSCLRVFRSHPNVQLVINKYIDTIGDDIVIIPYSPDLVETIKGLPKFKKFKWLFSHFGLNEGQLNSGISIISDLALKDLVGKFEYVILGHYHKPQSIITKDIKLYYIGSLIQLDWGERGDIKRFLVVDTDTGEITSVPTTKYKKYIQLSIENEEDKLSVIQEAREFLDQGHHIIINKVEKEIDTSDIESEFLVVDKTEKEITDRGITLEMSDKDKFRKYFEIKEIPEKEIPEYLAVVSEIIAKCADQEVQ